MQQNAKQGVIITGASSGIGAALAKEFSRRGYSLALLARRKERMDLLAQELRGENRIILSLECDVTNPESVKKSFGEAKKNLPSIDIVIANAGYAVSGAISHFKIDEYRKQFETNIFGVLHTFYESREALLNSRGIFAIVGSIAGHLPLPFAAPYSMSKSAIHSFAYEARLEMERQGVSVVLLSPGFIESEIGHVDNQGKSHSDPIKPIPKNWVVPVQIATRNMAAAILSRKREVVITLHGKWMVFFHRFFPTIAENWIYHYFRVANSKEKKP